MNDLSLFLEQLGGLHDCVVREIAWKPATRTIRLEIEDLCSNFEGLPEYPGAIPGSIELHDVEQVSFDIETDEERLNIQEFLVETQISGKCRASVSFWPTGRVTALYRNADFPQVTLRNVKS
jgi:hypothetical protein